MTQHTVRIGTRGSALARWQAQWVAESLRALGATVEIHFIETTGDVRSGPIGQLTSTGVFTKEIQRALLSRTVDLAVHSLKDLPTASVPGLALAAIPVRESVHDVLITRDGAGLAELAQGSRIGTGSLRRQAQLLVSRPDLAVMPIRGNVETRLQRIALGECDGVILAEAGLRRLGKLDDRSQTLPIETMLPAVGQGALGLEIRADDNATREWIRPLDDPATHQAVLAERSLLAHLRGGCLAPVGAWGRVIGNELHLDAIVLHPQGTIHYRSHVTGSPDQANSIGIQAAESLIQQGGAELLHSIRAEEA